MAAADLALVATRAGLSAMFFLSALDKFRAPPEEVRMIAALHLPAPAALERLTGVFETLAAAALLFGFFGRVAAAVLAIFVIFVTLVFLRFWRFEGPAEGRIGMRNIFFANIAVAAGLTTMAIEGLGTLVLADI